MQRKLGKPLDFPGDIAAWEKSTPMAAGILNSHFHEWLVLNEHTADGKFNIHDDSEFSWLRAWPIIARWFGMDWSPPVEDNSKYQVQELPLMPRGYVKLVMPAASQSRISGQIGDSLEQQLMCIT